MTLRPRSARALVLAALTLVAGCDKKMSGHFLPNEGPRVRITHAPRDTTIGCDVDTARCYQVTVYWTGYDPDGVVDHFRYAIDPPSAVDADTVWQTTTANHVFLTLSATRPLPSQPYGPSIARDYHVFVIEAVDNHGTPGAPDWRAFFAYTEAPEVTILDPPPTALSSIPVGPVTVVHWSGRDGDGATSQVPRKYKYTLLGPSSPITPAMALANPARLRDAYAPRFSDWDSVGGDTTVVRLTGLSLDTDYLFVVVAIDEAGAYSPVFRPETNMLKLRTTLIGRLGPKITAFSDAFQYSWKGEFCPCRASEATTELPFNTPFSVQWTAQAQSGAEIRSYRWALDIEDVNSDEPRTDESTDLAHWSSPSRAATSATVPAFNERDGVHEHLFYVEALDDVGFRSLAVIRLRTVPPLFRPNSLLIVKDTRLKPDNLNRATGCSARPVSIWPMQAELDTFLFARGGSPWRCYPSGTVTPAGLFSGYPFDTLGTRTRRTDLSVPISVLSRYDHVLWIVDQRSASFSADGLDFFEPMTSLRYMNDLRRANTLDWYVRLGGRVWLVGGGGGLASTARWNDIANDIGSPTFAAGNELRSGRFMYDVVGWRSEFRASIAPITLRRFVGRLATAPNPQSPYESYLSELPSQLTLKSAASDPLPPQRTSPGEFYSVTAGIEFIQQPNGVVERQADSTMVSVLDTLYEASGGDLPRDGRHNVVMTYAHGDRTPQGFVYTGFDLWSFRRADCVKVVDFVLGRIWNLARETALVGARNVGRATR